LLVRVGWGVGERFRRGIGQKWTTMRHDEMNGCTMEGRVFDGFSMDASLLILL